MKKIIYPLLLLSLLLLFEQCANPVVVTQTSSQRIQQKIASLDSLLQSAPQGWQLTYFPKVDSLLFTNFSSKLIGIDIDKNRYGFGGHTYWIRFLPGGNLEMLAINGADVTQHKGSYKIGLSESLQISFITYLPIHEMVTPQWGGASDLLFVECDWQNRIILRTAHSQEYQRQRIFLTPLPEDKVPAEEAKKALNNRLFFERMQNPQIRLKKGSRIYFESDVQLNDKFSDGSLNKWRIERRYFLFLYNLRRYGDYNFKGYNGLGSGYTETPEGLVFFPGFSFDGKHTVNFVKRKGDKFVAELVRIWDPIYQKYTIESKHLHPQGEPLPYYIEIFNATTPTN